MITTTENGWIVGDAKAELVEKQSTCNPPPTPLYSCKKPEKYITPEGSFPCDSDRLLLRPAFETINYAYPSPGYERSKMLRGAVAQWVRSKWGSDGEEIWSPIDSKYNEIRPGLEKLFSHKLWDRFTVIGSILHFAIPKREIAATIDLAVRFNDGGALGLISVWNGPDLRVHPKAAWADLGAAAEAMEINSLPVEKLGVLWVNNEGIKIEAKSGVDEGVNECENLWFDAIKLAKHARVTAVCKGQSPTLVGTGFGRMVTAS